MTTAINLIIDTPTRINIMRGWETERDKKNRALWLDHLYNWQAIAAFDRIPAANDTAKLDLNDTVNQWIAVSEKFNRDPIFGKIGRRKSERF